MAQRERPIEIINPPNMLKAKLGGPLPAADDALMKRAEAALDGLRQNFNDWLGEEVTKLEGLMRTVKTEGMQGEAGEALFTCAHDLRGLGSTYEFPIITRLAASLSKLIETPEQRASAPLALIDAHVGAIRAAIIQNVRDDKDPVGKALAEELEARVVALVGERS
ncbi:Hpt domain-containing protein [Alkalicaulis satelles]|uniref:Hpt domain-containing protein n=1 Tax=Alkalicaulis satelles TaxID=2609175 RepID=A0A5M6ZRT4_9PROT|nr:Hpt domain-containing protein [Alkalicaulis satelles]KAA5804991.1 Hpt domain-containing protein [Alkalicaulis satelles]